MAMAATAVGWGLEHGPAHRRAAPDAAVVVLAQMTPAARSAHVRAQAKRQVAVVAERRARYGTTTRALYRREARRMRVEATGYDLQARRIDAAI
ncbi:MAG: hypothetical protein ACT4QF_11530 [Sporichthyaceae bacterium]|jgi:hypothetical protein